MKQIYFSFKRNKLIEAASLRKLDKIVKLQNYVCQIYNCQSDVQRNSLTYNREITRQSLSLLQDVYHSKLQKTWIQLIFIEILLNKCNSQILTEEFSEYLGFQCEQLQRHQFKGSSINQKSLVRKLSDKFLNVKSSLFGTNNKENQDNCQNFFNKIIQQIFGIRQKKRRENWEVNYLQIVFQRKSQFLSQKIIDNNTFIEEIKKINKVECINQKGSQDLEELRQNVWKVVNLLKHFTKVTKYYRNFQTVELEIKPFMLMTFNLFAKNLLIMYPLIVHLIEVQLKILKKLISPTDGKNISKQERRKNLEVLKENLIFIELKILFGQLQELNETVFYVFIGQHHRNKMAIKLPHNFILNVGNPRLDFFYFLVKETQQIKQKKVKAKQNCLKFTSQINMSKIQGFTQQLKCNRSCFDVLQRRSDSRNTCNTINDSEGQDKCDFKFHTKPIEQGLKDLDINHSNIPAISKGFLTHKPYKISQPFY